MDSWAEYGALVLNEIKRLDENIKRLSDSNLKVQVDMSKLKLWIMIFVGIGGAVCSILLKELVGKW